MVAYSFRPRFERPILEKRKRQTLRAVGKRRHALPGDELQLYVGMRTANCRLICRAECISFDHISIDFDDWIIETSQWSIGPGRRYKATVHPKTIRMLDSFAQDDGFESWNEMRQFWGREHFKGRTPHGVWKGVIIKW